MIFFDFIKPVNDLFPIFFFYLGRDEYIAIIHFRPTTNDYVEDGKWTGEILDNYVNGVKCNPPKQNSARFRISDQPQFFRFVTFYLYFCAGF